jgi:PAS domain S-box-containing protein
MDAIFQTGPDGKIYSANPAACNLFGRTEEELLESGRSGIVDITDRRLDAGLKERERKSKFSGELTFIKKDGTRFPGEVTSNVFYDSDGRQLTSTIIRDISEKRKALAELRENITRQKKLEADLRKSKELLEKLNQHLLEVWENERNQIALNLHDDLGQKFTAINLEVAWLKSRIGVQSEAVKEKIKEISLMIVEAIESVRLASSLLRPAILFDIGLVPAIKVQLMHFEKQTGIKCHFYCNSEQFILDNRILLILYRILQESLTNIARHSGASITEINLNVGKEKAEMSIKDNGKGISREQINSFKSMGIQGIKERVRSIGGKLLIKGINGSGTTIKVSIPLN